MIKHHFTNNTIRNAFPSALLSLLLCCLISLPGCKKIDKEALQKMDYVGVAVIAIDKNINTNMLMNIGFDNSELKIDTLKQAIHDKVFQQYQKLVPLKLIKEEKFITTDSYKNFTLFNESREERAKEGMVGPDGYHAYKWSHLTDNNFKRFFKVAPEKADGIMAVHVDYILKALSTPGEDSEVRSARVEAQLQIKIIDKDGTTVLEAKEEAKGDGSINVPQHGSYHNAGEMTEACISATHKCLGKVETFLQEELGTSS